MTQITFCTIFNKKVTHVLKYLFRLIKGQMSFGNVFEIPVIVPLPLSAAEKALCYSGGRVGHGPFVTWFCKAQRPCSFLTVFSAFLKTYPALNTRQFHEFFSAKSLLINNFLVSGCILTEKKHTSIDIYQLFSVVKNVCTAK